MEISVFARGADVRGEIFAEEARTVVVSRLGATILLKRVLLPGALLTIRNLVTGTEGLCKMVAQVGEHSEGYLYGLSVTDPMLNLWGISFPPLAKSKNAAARLLLHCGSCRAGEIVYLDEMEAEVFAAHESVSRFCSDCQRRTLWQMTEADSHARTLRANPQRVQNDRAHPRVPARLRSCIRQLGFGDELLFTENVSRGGFSFKSPNHYYSGSIVQAAVPYSATNGNVFVPARIAYSRALPSEGLVQHGAAYIVADAKEMWPIKAETMPERVGTRHSPPKDIRR